MVGLTSSPFFRQNFLFQSNIVNLLISEYRLYRGADKSLVVPGRKAPRNRVRKARDLNKMETRLVIKFVFLQGKAPKEIHSILSEILACFLPGRTEDLSAPQYFQLDKFY